MEFSKFTPVFDYFQANHAYICESHKSTIQNFRNQQKSKESKMDNGFNCEPSKVTHTDVMTWILSHNYNQIVQFVF